MKSAVCHRSQCSSFDEVKENILVMHLGALGAVVRSTALLRALKRKHPHSRMVWVTQAPAHHLLAHHPLIDHVVLLEDLKLHPLTALDYSHGYCIDKSLVAVRALKEFKVERILGFTADSISGAILPATDAAFELWELGLSNHKKFFVNQKTESQLVHEALELGEYKRDEYELALTPAEKVEAKRRRKMWGRRILVGFNVGCSSVIPYKKLPVEKQRELIRNIQAKWGEAVQCVLLGGREDLELAQAIARELDVIISPMDRGLRDGMVSLSACDLVVTGDSLGLHLGVAFRKWVVAWFGPTCAHEIDLYDRGVKVMAQVECSPCWKRQCNQPTMCYDQVPIQELLLGIEEGVKWKSLSSRPPSLEICS